MKKYVIMKGRLYLNKNRSGYTKSLKEAQIFRSEKMAISSLFPGERVVTIEEKE